MPRYVITETCEWATYAPNKEVAIQRVADAITSCDPRVHSVQVTERDAEMAPGDSCEAEDCPSCEAGEDPWLEKCSNCDGTGYVGPFTPNQ